MTTLSQRAAAAQTETEAPPELELEEGAEIALPWNVVVLNDPVNLMSYVAFVLRKLFGFSEDKATRLMLEVHERGRSVVWTGSREKAELYVQQLQGHQLLSRIEQVKG